MKRPALVILYVLSLLPAVRADPLTSPPASRTILDRYGRPLRILRPAGEEFSEPVALETVSPWILLATLAAEDRRFFQHPGVDLRAAARALWQNGRKGRVISGASTMTQQLVRLLEPHPKTLRGKLREAASALMLERRSSKHDIFESYLNHVSYGNGCQGVESAARTYFDVGARDLSLGQAALIAGIPQSPLRNDPVRHRDRAAARQRTILKRLLDWGWIDAATLRLAQAERLPVSAAWRPWSAPHFTEEIRRRIPVETPLNAPSIRTTLDGDLQESLQTMLATRIDSLKSYHVTNGALVVLDNATGEVLAWVGSADFFDEANQGQVDGVTALRQPGSALKPFAYGVAFSRDLKPSDLLLDEPLFDNGYMPRNYDETYHGPVRAREALASSFNVPAVRVAQQMGAASLLTILRDFGLTSLDRPADYYGLGLVLGNGEVPLLQLTNAYATLARGGQWVPTRIMQDEAPAAMPHRTLSRDVCYLVTDILADNSARARAFGFNSPFHLPFAMAAKTGTTKDYHDNWAMGYTPGWTIGVWVGNFDAKPMRGVSGITGAAPLLHDAALLVWRRYGALPFALPSGVTDIEICPDSGRLPGLNCPNTMHEFFLKTNRPATVCHLHRDSPAQPVLHERSALQIRFPAPGDIFKIDPRMPRASQMIRLRCDTPVPPGKFHWLVDSHEIPSEGPAAWWMLKAGRHRVRLRADTPSGATQSTTVSFLVVP